MDSVSISLNKGNIWISEYDSNSWFRARNKIQIWSGHDRGVPFSDNHLSLQVFGGGNGCLTILGRLINFILSSLIE